MIYSTCRCGAQGAVIVVVLALAPGEAPKRFHPICCCTSQGTKASTMTVTEAGILLAQLCNIYESFREEIISNFSLQLKDSFKINLWHFIILKLPFQSNSALWLVLTKVYRGQLWKGKQKKNYKEKLEWKRDGVYHFIIIKLQKHLVIVKMKSFRRFPHLMLKN